MLIGLCGGMKAGKDTAFRLLDEMGAPATERRAFAEPMKESFCEFLGITREDFETNKRNKNARITFTVDGEVTADYTLREAIQRYGDEAHRQVFGELFWVDLTLPFEVEHSDTTLCVTDARYYNEMQRVRDLGGYNVLIRRTEPVDEATEVSAAHSSETSIDMSLVDYIIDNTEFDDDFETYKTQLQIVLDDIQKTEERPHDDHSE